MASDDPKASARIAALHEEMDAIHLANTLYWKEREGARGHAERAEHQHRQDRLEEIRSELARLRRADFS